MLAEYGVVFAEGLGQLRKAVVIHMDRMKTTGLTERFKQLLESQYTQLLFLDEQIASYTKQLEEIAEQEAVCQRVQQVEGIGAITAVALAALGDPKEFKNGRHFAAYLGLVPKQHSSGGRKQLLGISKRGDGYLRKLLVQGARSVLIRAEKKSDARSRWLVNLNARAGSHRTCVALANKNARIVCAMLLKNEGYRPGVLEEAIA